MDDDRKKYVISSFVKLKFMGSDLSLSHLWFKFKVIDLYNLNDNCIQNFHLGRYGQKFIFSKT